MAQAQPDDKEEGPFLALNPLVVLNKVRVCEERIEGEEGRGVDV